MVVVESRSHGVCCYRIFAQIYLELLKRRDALKRHQVRDEIDPTFVRALITLQLVKGCGKIEEAWP